MYIPELFEENDQARIYGFIRENSFGIIVSNGDKAPVATHTPLLLMQQGDKPVLAGHIAAKNAQSAALLDGAEVLCIFNGPHAYVSPQWYEDMDAPDWNYRAVHAYGVIRRLTGEEGIKKLSAMTDFYESAFEKPARVSDIPPAVLEAALREMVVFEVGVTRFEAIARLSQDHTDSAHRNIAQNLKQQDDVNAMLVAFEMERRKKK